MLIERVREKSIEEFLDFAESREEWYEYIDGELREMPREMLSHYAITTNMTLLLGRLLTDSDCIVLGAGMLVKSGGSRLIAPDGLVISEKPKTEFSRRLLLNPVMVVEVTSRSSIDYDRNEKADYYFDVPSIQAYLIVEQERPLVELYTRGAEDWHVRTIAGMNDAVDIDALDCRLPLRDIYENIDFEMKE